MDRTLGTRNREEENWVCGGQEEGMEQREERYWLVLAQDAQFKVQGGSRKLIVGYGIMVEIYIVDEISRVLNLYKFLEVAIELTIWEENP